MSLEWMCNECQIMSESVSNECQIIAESKSECVTNVKS